MKEAGRRQAFEVNVFFLILILLLTVSIAASPPQGELEPWDFPRLDEIYFKMVYPSFEAVDKAKACEIDNVVNLRDSCYVEELESLGWNISIQPGDSSYFGVMKYFGINCRNVTPDSSGKYYNYHNRTPGFELRPLNISSFRYALHLLIGDQKDVWAEDIFGLPERLDTMVSPANRYWFNPCIRPVPYDSVKAYTVLIEAGFSNTSGYWICPNGQEMRHMYVAVAGPSHWKLVTKCVDSWNKFFGKMSDDVTDYFEIDLIDFDHLIFVAFYNCDHDIYFMHKVLSRNPDYLYYEFHSDMNVWNSGLASQPLDDCLWTLKYWRNATTHELITDMEKLREICYKIQWMLYNGTGDPEAACPYIPIAERKLANLYKPGLTDWVESPGYGSAPYEMEMPWTYLNIHWEDQPVGGSVNWHIGGPIQTLNPGKVDYEPEFTILNRISDSLIAVDPHTRGYSLDCSQLDDRRLLKRNKKRNRWLKDHVLAAQ